MRSPAPGASDSAARGGESHPLARSPAARTAAARDLRPDSPPGESRRVGHVAVEPVTRLAHAGLLCLCLAGIARVAHGEVDHLLARRRSLLDRRHHRPAAVVHLFGDDVDAVLVVHGEGLALDHAAYLVSPAPAAGGSSWPPAPGRVKRMPVRMTSS